MGWLENRFEKNFLITTVDYVFNWARKSAVWPMTFGLACCAIEMIASSTARFDIARFGSEATSPPPTPATPPASSWSRFAPLSPAESPAPVEQPTFANVILSERYRA